MESCHSQIDIAPTVARLLGLELKNIEGTPLVGVLEPSTTRR